MKEIINNDFNLDQSIEFENKESEKEKLFLTQREILIKKFGLTKKTFSKKRKRKKKKK
jgi:hypothetical protein